MDCSFIGWCALTAEQQAAWAQAALSFVAILIAIAIPAIQRWLDRQDRQRLEADEALKEAAKARSLAMSLLGDFQKLSNNLNKIYGYEHEDQQPEDAALGPYTLKALKIPPRLHAMAYRLHDLGQAGEAGQRCLYHVRRAREYTTTLEDGTKVAFDRTEFYDHLWEALKAAVVVLNAIDDMFRAKATSDSEGNSGDLDR
ncbi:MAG TPA: hypothetical protein VEY92_03740 [Pseudoxanthomonas sp.]|nr:hypothetical protein [Pseudoxanthomonas sp.]